MIFFLIFLFFLFINCERLYIPPKPEHVPSNAQFIHRFQQWQYSDPSIELVWYKDGKLFKKIEKKNNVYHGKYEQYFSNGSKSQEGIYEDGYRVGTWYYYFPDGKIYLILNYKKEPVNSNFFSLNSYYGNENGMYKRFYQNGNLEEEGNYLAGIFHGKRIRYYKYGKKYFEIIYNNGLKNGLAKYYNSDGRIIREEHYHNDKLINLIQYN